VSGVAVNKELDGNFLLECVGAHIELDLLNVINMLVLGRICGRFCAGVGDVGCIVVTSYEAGEYDGEKQEHRQKAISEHSHKYPRL
jgi:hypothetical protein